MNKLFTKRYCSRDDKQDYKNLQKSLLEIGISLRDMEQEKEND
jgi:hypothetical protein